MRYNERIFVHDVTISIFTDQWKICATNVGGGNQRGVSLRTSAQCKMVLTHKFGSEKKQTDWCYVRDQLAFIMASEENERDAYLQRHGNQCGRVVNYVECLSIQPWVGRLPAQHRGSRIPRIVLSVQPLILITHLRTLRILGSFCYLQ